MDKNGNLNNVDDSNSTMHRHKLSDVTHVSDPIKRRWSAKFLPGLIFVIAFGGFGAYYLVSSKANPETTNAKQQSAVAQARQATLDIGAIDRALEKGEKTELRNQYAELALERKQLIRQLLDKGQAKEVWSLMNTEGQKRANTNAEAHLEKRTSFSQATLRLDHGHTLDEINTDGNQAGAKEDGGKHTFDYYYIEQNNTRRRIHLTKEVDDKFLNKKIKATEVAELDGELIADTDQLQLEAMQEAAVTAPLTTKKVAAVLFKFSTTTTTPFTKEQVKTAVFGATGSSANTYFKETSFGKIGLAGKTDPTGDVFDWVTITGDTTACNYTTWSTAADAALKAKGVDLTGYSNIMYFFPSTGGCGWGGMGQVGSPTAPATTTYRSWIRGSTSVRIISHELGHNFGTRHAGSYKCTENGTPVIYSSVTANCTLNTYGDPFDVMGYITRQLSGYFKLRSGYLPASSLQTITASGTYLLKNPESLSTGAQTIRIPAVVANSGVATDWYYLEYRQPSGSYDNFAATDPVVNGISVRIGKDLTDAYSTQLLDMNPATTTMLDSPLAFGKTFTDASRNLTITAVSAANGVATIKVASSAPACTQNTPTISINPTAQWGNPGQVLSYAITVKNNDTAACTAQTFAIAGTMPAGLTQALSSSSVSLTPGASTTLTAKITSASTIAAGYYTFTDRLTRSGSTTVLGSVTANYNVNQVVNQPPIVTISSPANGSVVTGKKATVSAYATSTSSAPVNTIKAYIDGTLVFSSTSSINYSWNLAKVKSGPHTVTVTATNSAGQSATKTITITKP